MVSSHKRWAVAVVVVAMLPPVAAFADRVFWGCSYGEPRVLHSGPIACRQEVRQCDNMVLSCSRGTESLFSVHDFADYIAASDDGRYVVGLSNRGSENAFWIRNSKGRVIERKTHYLGPRHLPGVHYCTMSVTKRARVVRRKEPRCQIQIQER